MSTIDGGGSEQHIPQLWLAGENGGDQPIDGDDMLPYLPDTSSAEVDAGSDVDVYVAAENLYPDYTGSMDGHAEVDEGTAEFGEGDEGKITVLICGGEGPWVSPGQLEADPEGNQADFSWWFNGTGGRYDETQSNDDVLKLRPIRSGEATALIADHFNTSPDVVGEALSTLGLKDRTAFNRWHVREDFGSPSYGELMAAAIGVLTQGQGMEGTAGQDAETAQPTESSDGELHSGDTPDAQPAAPDSYILLLAKQNEGKENR
jgi:hypothetical protein